MSFTISDAIIQAESWLDKEIVLGDDALLWANEFLQNELDSRAWTEDTEEYLNSVKGTWYDLPSDFLSVASIVMNTGNNKQTVSDNIYIVRRNKVSFKMDGDYTMDYVSIPVKMTGLQDDVSLSDVFLYPMAYFIAYRQLSKFGQNAEKAEYYRHLYAMNLKSVLSELELDSNGAGFQVEMRWS